jgi:hypothetical protein
MNHMTRWITVAALLGMGLCSLTAAENTDLAPGEMPHYGKWVSVPRNASCVP